MYFWIWLLLIGAAYFIWGVCEIKRHTRLLLTCDEDRKWWHKKWRARGFMLILLALVPIFFGTLAVIDNFGRKWGEEGSVCNTESDCNFPLDCAIVSGSRICVAVGDGSAGSVCGTDSHCDFFCLSGQCSDGNAGSPCVFDSHCASGVCNNSFLQCE